MSGRSAHVSLRRAAASLKAHSPGATINRLSICRRLLANDSETLSAASLSSVECEFVIERHYWISALYMLLMPTIRRQRLAAYFTPPHLCKHIIDRLTHYGLAVGRDRVLDPA